MHKKSKVKVGYLTFLNPLDKGSWSGSHCRMYHALQQEFEEVVPLGPIPVDLSVRIINRIKNLFHTIFLGGKYNFWHNKLVSKSFVRKIETKLKEHNIDVLFAPAAAVEIAMLNTDIPICYLSDTSFEQIRDYYKAYTNFSKSAVKESNFVERNAIHKASAVVYTSDWAANFVTDFYQRSKADIHVVCFGANIDKAPENYIKRDYSGKIRILFLGLDWNRKGGDIVLDTFKLLEAKGYNVELYIVGCTPNTKIESNNITVIPFLNKNKKEDNDRFLEIMNNTHLLFVPTRADCTPIVFCEANAFGMPVITSDTGGVTSIIKNGENGYALPHNARAEDYANTIEYLLKNPKEMEAMSVRARLRYENVLNWDKWGERMRQIMDGLVR